jgi:TRAP-type C4-dicarboxylate transport system permease small subunit
MKEIVRKAYHFMNRISEIISKVVSAVSVLFVVGVIFTVALQIVNRYVIVKVSDYSATFTDELARFLLIWIVYTAIGMCLREGSMSQVDIIYSRLGKRGRIALYVFVRLVMLAVLYVTIRYGFWYAGKKKAYHSTMMNIPGQLLYLTVSIGGCLMLFEVITEMLGVFCGEVEPFQASRKRFFPWHEEPLDESGQLLSLANLRKKFTETNRREEGK